MCSGTCRMPEEDGERMISCESCKQWFHEKCITMYPRRHGQMIVTYGIALTANRLFHNIILSLFLIELCIDFCPYLCHASSLSLFLLIFLTDS